MTELKLIYITNHFVLIVNILSQDHLKLLLKQKYYFYYLIRISGKYVTLTFIHMEMLKDNQMEPAGKLYVNMEKDNVKEIPLKYVLLRNTT